MLSAIKAALMEKIAAYLENHSFLMNRDVQSLCHVSSATANRILGQLVDEGNHSNYFYAFLTMLMPDRKTRKQALDHYADFRL